MYAVVELEFVGFELKNSRDCQCFAVAFHDFGCLRIIPFASKTAFTRLVWRIGIFGDHIFVAAIQPFRRPFRVVAYLGDPDAVVVVVPV